MEKRDLNTGVSRRDLMRGVGAFAAGMAIAQQSKRFMKQQTSIGGFKSV